MRSTLIRIAILGVAAFAGAASPALAQMHPKHRTYQTTPYANGFVDPALESAYVAAHPGAPAGINNQPGACFTDEGYGRYASCDQAGN